MMAVSTQARTLFDNVYCSQCGTGNSHGPGYSGFSHCETHRLISRLRRGEFKLAERLVIQQASEVGFQFSVENNELVLYSPVTAARHEFRSFAALKACVAKLQAHAVRYH